MFGSWCPDWTCRSGSMWVRKPIPSFECKIGGSSRFTKLSTSDASIVFQRILDLQIEVSHGLVWHTIEVEVVVLHKPHTLRPFEVCPVRVRFRAQLQLELRRLRHVKTQETKPHLAKNQKPQTDLVSQCPTVNIPFFDKTLIAVSLTNSFSSEVSLFFFSNFATHFFHQGSFASVTRWRHFPSWRFFSSFTQGYFPYSWRSLCRVWERVACCSNSLISDFNPSTTWRLASNSVPEWSQSKGNQSNYKFGTRCFSFCVLLAWSLNIISFRPDRSHFAP